MRNSSKLGSLFSNFHFPTMSSIVKWFVPRDRSSENPKGRMNGNDFTLTKDHLLWHCDITTSSFTQISHRTASGAINWRRRRTTTWCFQDSSICLSFQQTGTCAVSRQGAQRYPSETQNQIETIDIIIIVQKGNPGTWQMTPFSSIKSPTLRSTTVSLVAPVFPSVNSRVRR